MTSSQYDEIIQSLGRVHHRLDEANADISAIRSDMSQQLGVCIGCQEKLNRCFTDLHGNGREGVISTQTRHDEAIQALKTRVKRLGVPAKTVRQSQQVSVSAIIIAIATALTALFGWLASVDAGFPGSGFIGGGGFFAEVVVACPLFAI